MNIATKILHNFTEWSDKTAVFYDNYSLTYGELSKNVLSIAGYFQCQGIKSRIVAVKNADPVEHLATILGIMLSGNAYFSVTDENVHHVLGDNQTITEITVVGEKEAAEDAISGEKITYPELIAGYRFSEMDFVATAPFCVFVTSGSSGKAKIVTHSLKNINEDILRQINENGTSAADCYDFVFSFSFSASLASIYPPLVVGGSICLLPAAKIGISKVVEGWDRLGVTYSTLSVSMFRAICKTHASFKHFKHLRTISLSAEPANTEILSLFKEKFDTHTTLQLAYATTETRTIAKVHLNEADGSLGKYFGGVGKAVANKEIRILDEHGQPAPEGEIVVASEYIASQYEGNTELSAATFFQFEERINYRTGDKGYLDLDGNLFITGRISQTIKINGVKIDLALIEKAIFLLPYITNAAVVINNTVNNQNTIVAFIEIGQQTEIRLADIQQQIAKTLSINSRPHFYCRLERIPTTHSGKVDRMRLETLEFETWIEYNEKEGNNTSDLERFIIEAYNETLNITTASLQSRFFDDLGGDSLAGLVAIALLEKKHSIRLPAYSLWTNQSPFLLAQFINSGSNNNLVHYEKVKFISEAHRTIFFVNDFKGGNNYGPLVTLLKNTDINIIHLFYNLEESEVTCSPESVIERLCNIVSIHNTAGAAVIGFSFNGFMARHISSITPDVQLCIMIDTINYYEKELYNNAQTSLSKWYALLHNTIFSRDFSLPIRLLAHRVKIGSALTPIYHNKLHDKESFKKGVNYFLSCLVTDRPPLTNCNILFIKASRGFVYYLAHGHNWRPYTKGSFQLAHMRCLHQDMLLEKNASILAKHIIGAIS